MDHILEIVRRNLVQQTVLISKVYHHYLKSYRLNSQSIYAHISRFRTFFATCCGKC